MTTTFYWRTIAWVLSSGLMLSCSRPSGCLSGNCESTNTSQTTTSSTGQANPNATPEVTAQKNSGTNLPSPPGGDGADAMKAMITGFQNQMALQTLVANVEALLTTMDDQQLENIRRAIDGFSNISSNIENQQKDWGKNLEAAKIKQDKSASQLWNVINDYAKQKEATRLNLIKQLEKLESDLLDILTPEGVSAQIQWDKFLAKLDVVREQIVKSEILTTREDMLKAAETTYASDKNALKSVIEGIIQTNLALADASGPAVAARTMRQLRNIETQLQMTTNPKDEQIRVNLAKQIEETQKKLKSPLDAVDPKMFPEIVAIVTEIKTAEGNIAGLEAGAKSVNDIIQQQKDIFLKLSGAFSSLNAAAIALRTKPVTTPSNGQIIGESLVATESVLKGLSSGMNDILAGLDSAAKADISKGLPTAAIKQLIEGETSLQQGLEAVAMSLTNLGKVYEAKSNCSKGSLVSPDGPLPLRSLLCGGDPLVALSAP